MFFYTRNSVINVMVATVARRPAGELPETIELTASPVVSRMNGMLESYRQNGSQEFFNRVGSLTSRLRHENGRLHKAFENYLLTLNLGQERAGIFKDYGVLVLDAGGTFSEAQLNDIRQVLSASGRNVAGRAAYAIFADTTTREDEGKNGAWGVGAEYYSDGGSIRLLVDSRITQSIIHHELGHGIHDRILSEDLFAEFSQVGGWRLKSGGMLIKPSSLKGYMKSDRTEWVSSEKCSEFAKAYGMANPFEDFSTLYEAWTTDSAGIWAKAEAAKNAGNDVLHRKLTFMKDKVFTRLAALPSGEKFEETSYFLKTADGKPAKEFVVVGGAKTTHGGGEGGFLAWLWYHQLLERQKMLDDQAKGREKTESQAKGRRKPESEN